MAIPTVAFADTQSESVSPMNAAVNYYKFFKTIETVLKYDGSPLKVSPDATGPGSITATITRTVNATFSSTLASSNQSLINATVTGSFGYSLTTSIGISLIIDSRTAYMAFQPYKIRVDGNLKYYSSLYPTTPLSTTAVYAKYPKKTDFGDFDGRFYIIYY